MILDRYVHPAPAEGWPRWMDQNLDEAKFVLMVCTQTYRQRVRGREEPGKGLGVRWEGSLNSNRIQQFPACGFRPENTLVLISHFANSLRTMFSRIPYLTAWANGVTRHGTCFR